MRCFVLLPHSREAWWARTALPAGVGGGSLLAAATGGPGAGEGCKVTHCQQHGGYKYVPYIGYICTHIHIYTHIEKYLPQPHTESVAKEQNLFLKHKTRENRRAFFPVLL